MAFQSKFFFVKIGGKYFEFSFQSCDGKKLVCDDARKAVSELMYSSTLQKHLVQAEYWHDPLNEKTYIEKSGFIAEINNEGATPNPSYAENLKKLQKMALVMFEEVIKRRMC